MSERIWQAVDALGRAQARRPFVFAIVGILISLGTIPFIRTLSIDTSFIALLPHDRPSVRDLEAAEGRLRNTANITIGIMSPSADVEEMRAYRERLLERLHAVPEDELGMIDESVAPYRDFVREHAHLFARMEDLTELRDALEEKLREERLRANPFFVDLEDDEEEAEGEEEGGLESIVDRIRSRGSRSDERFPDGMYQHPSGTLLAVFVRIDKRDQRPNEVIARVQSIIDADPPSAHGDLEVAIAGDAIVANEEKAAVAAELSTALGITLLGVCVVVMLFFRRLRAIPLLGIGLLPGTLLGFALASFTVGELNLTTAFLGSVLLGNGVNPSIIWLARYFEERGAGRETEQAILNTHRGVLSATLVASAAAAAAYASLVITDFRGFRDFGIIGGAGMVFCWFSALLCLPAGAAMFERFKPLELPAERRASFTELFVKLAQSRPVPVLAVSAALTVASIAGLVMFVAGDPIEYDFRQLRSERDPNSSPTRRINSRVNEILDSTTQGRGVALLARNADDVAHLRAQLDQGDPDDYAGYRSIENLLPRDVEAKLPLLAEIRELMQDIEPYADEEQQEFIEEWLPPESITPPTAADIPLAAARLFVERDGSRGLVLVITEAERFSTWDGRYLIRWTQALRGLRFEDGERPLLIGRAPIFADMIDAVYADMPKAISAALLVTILLALFGFRRFRTRIAALWSLILGVVWMAAAMAGVGMKLHFLNFIAFPITFGNGVDYPVNVLRRYENEVDEHGDEEHAMLTSVRESGGAVLLCSLTTIIGYSSLYASANLAMNSFGLAMAISEVTCCLAALLTVPCYFIWKTRRTRGATDAPEAP